MLGRRGPKGLTRPVKAPPIAIQLGNSAVRPGYNCSIGSPLFKTAACSTLLYVQLAMAFAVLLNIFHIAIVKRGEVGPGFSVGTKQLIELSVESLGISVLGSVNEQRHQPCCQGRYCCPAESLR
jgi:hypothetical protein